MSNVKKAFQPIHDALSAMDPNTRVSKALPQILHLMQSKGSGGEAHDPIMENGKPVAYYCAFYKRYFKGNRHGRQPCVCSQANPYWR